MHQTDLNRVKFYSKEDMAGGHELSKAEKTLKNERQPNYNDINDILELYNIKKYFDNQLYLKYWTEEDISNFNARAAEYGKAIGQFLSTVNDDNFIVLYEATLRGYIDSFWELINDQSVFKRISKVTFNTVLSTEPHIIHLIIIYKRLVDHFESEVKNFLLSYSKSAEILLSIYERKNDASRNQKYIPNSISQDEKEDIIANYLDSADFNLNYVALIPNARNKPNFKISDKIRLKARRLYKSEINKIFSNGNSSEQGVFIKFPENTTKIKDAFIDNFIATYSYSLNYIKQNCNPYSLFENFKLLFEYTDEQNRINLISKKSQILLMERTTGIRAQNEYFSGIAFNFSEMSSTAQIFAYSKILTTLNNSLEDILHFVFTSEFHKRYGFADNARFSIPSITNSYFEKLRLLAPEFEAILKQFKLFVEDGQIDFELLQISSSPSTMKDIPSLNQNKYIYFNENNKDMVACSNLFFSDQTLLSFVDPFKEKQYDTFFNLLINENVNINNYEEYQQPQITYLLEKGMIFVDNNSFIQIKNIERLFILKDLRDNEFASFYHYKIEYQKEAQQMAAENIILFESSLFSKQEQAYFNYFLNKSEFTNGMDLRNSYLHGTQANPNEVEIHELAYSRYLKLLVLTMLKIDDDLFIYNLIKNTEKAIY